VARRELDVDQLHSGWSEQLPNSMFMSWLASLPVVAGAIPRTTSNAPLLGRIDSTVATMSPTDALVVDRLRRHLDALLGRERLGARADVR
jgi:hypothetical protein